MPEAKEKKKKIAIIGLPNTGKSQVFNNLTREYTLVANYPFTTVEIKKGTCIIGNDHCEVMDTPGLHGLYIHSEEELAVRDMLLRERPDIIIQCVDANQLKQSLVLTVDLLELGIPMVISLNAVDETSRKGVWIDSSEISRLLGVPVIESVAINGIGKKELVESLTKAKTGRWIVRHGEMIENGISLLESKLPGDIIAKRKLAILLLLEDPFLIGYLRKAYGEALAGELEAVVRDVKHRFRGSIARAINTKRDRWIDDVFSKTTRKQRIQLGGFSQTFARLSRHPVFGIPILGGFLIITYLLVVHVAGFLNGLLSAYLLNPTVEYVSGVIAPGFWHDFLVGHYGMLTLGFFNAIVTVLPILSVFFLMFSFLEDIGYIPNLCVLVKRIFEKIGLTGKAVMPLILAFGCKTMATLVTKGLRSRKEKFIAIYLIAFAIPCSAQFAIDIGILGKVSFGAFLIAYSFLFLVEIAAGFILNKTIKDDSASDFIQELPAVRLPSPKAVVVKTYHRMYWFLKEAIPIFIIAAVVLFFMEKSGILGWTKSVLSPIVVNWLGLPLDIVDALILSLARHEAAAALLFNMVDAGALNYIQAIVAVVITTMFVPCFANIVAMCKELGVRTGISMALAINVSSFILAGIVNWVLIFTIGRFVL